ncbi:hypothetical protein QQP08_008593 [Theobroma cacao]|nr:hypothetical protein QQP08_008593 [Theobroma cacao]
MEKKTSAISASAKSRILSNLKLLQMCLVNPRVLCLNSHTKKGIKNANKPPLTIVLFMLSSIFSSHLMT